MNILQPCNYYSVSCNDFNRVNIMVIDLVNKYYFDLQMFANFVIDIDNQKTPISETNNFITQYQKVIDEYSSFYPDIDLFDPKRMIDMNTSVRNILENIPNVVITSNQYSKNIQHIEFFGVDKHHLCFTESL